MSVDYTNDLLTVNKPALIVWGDKDLITLAADQKTMSTNLKNSRLIVYEETGHALHWELPERFARDLVEFIRDNVATQPQAK